MLPVLARESETLAALCRRHHVARLEVFGSAATGVGFRPGQSDYDFLVTFSPVTEGTQLGEYLGLAEGLERLRHARVDLVTERSIRNPYFRQSVNASRQTVYTLEGTMRSSGTPFNINCRR